MTRHRDIRGLVVIAALLVAPVPLLAQFKWPGTGRVSSNWDSPRSYGKHKAIDIASGTTSKPPIVAAHGGVVSFADLSCGLDCGYGNLVIVDHPNSYETYYAHNSSFAVSKGAKVKQCQTIAYEGSTGNSSGPHVHYEIRRYGTKLYITAALDSYLTRCTDVPDRYRSLLVPDLFAIKMNNTGSGKTEVHAMLHPNYTSWKVQTATPLGTTNRDRWAFGLGDYDYDSHPDLYAIKMNNTGSGKTEVHILSGASNYQNWLLNVATPLHETNRDQWAFAVGDADGDGRSDVYAIRMNGTTKTELHILNGSSGYKEWLLQRQTPLGPTYRDRYAFVVADHDQDGKDDLYAVQMNNTSSGKTEVHILSASSSFGTWIVHSATALGVTSPSNWSFGGGDYDRDGVGDLIAIKSSSTGSAKTEAHVLSGAGSYKSWLAQKATALGEVSLSQFWFDTP